MFVCSGRSSDVQYSVTMYQRILIPPSSLRVFRGVFVISVVGLGPLRQSLFTHQTGTPPNDPRCHSLSTSVEGGHIYTTTANMHTHRRRHSLNVTGGTCIRTCLAWFVTHCLCLQVSMLGSRCAVIMLFTRIFRQWILGVIGESGSV